MVKKKNLQWLDSITAFRSYRFLRHKASSLGAEKYLILWKNIADFDLEKWRAKLDEQGLKIGNNQENSLKNRRKLAESTRGKPVYLSLVYVYHLYKVL